MPRWLSVVSACRQCEYFPAVESAQSIAGYGKSAGMALFAVSPHANTSAALDFHTGQPILDMASTLAALITRIVSLPFTLVGLVLSRLLGIRRLPSSLRLSAAWSGSAGDSDSPSAAFASDYGSSSSAIIDPVVAAQWFLRYIKTCDPDPDGQGVDGALWYSKGGYNAALRRAKEDCEVLCVVLTSKEHDDNAAFLRWVSLFSPGLVMFHR